jgi:SAM-dependent methyltransferase
MHDNSQLMFDRYAKAYFTGGQRVLEIGATLDTSACRASVGLSSVKWETLELTKWGSLPGVTYAASDEYQYPIPESTFDIVVSTNVAEHVRKLWTWMAELRRIVKPGGLIITVAPISWPYHDAPGDCWRLYPEAMRALCEWGSLEAARYWRVRPGRGRISSIAGSRRRYACFRVLSWLGYAVEVAYDLVAVARKPTEATA